MYYQTQCTLHAVDESVSANLQIKYKIIRNKQSVGTKKQNLINKIKRILQAMTRNIHVFE